MTPQEQFFENQKRLELTEANTQDIIQRYDNAEYHKMIWSHRITCNKCKNISFKHSDTVDKVEPFCPHCESPAEITPYVEIVEYDEAYCT